MRQAHSHLTGTFGELSKQIIAFSSQTTVTIYTRLPLQKKKKKDDNPCSPRRQEAIYTFLSAGFHQVSMALSIWQLVPKSD